MDAEVAQTSDWALRAVATTDIEPLADLRAVVMRPDLERLGRYDEHRVRQRLRDSLSPRAHLDHPGRRRVRGLHHAPPHRRQAVARALLPRATLPGPRAGIGDPALDSGANRRSGRDRRPERSAGQRGPPAVRAARFRHGVGGPGRRLHDASAEPSLLKGIFFLLSRSCRQVLDYILSRQFVWRGSANVPITPARRRGRAHHRTPRCRPHYSRGRHSPGAADHPRRAGSGARLRAWSGGRVPRARGRER